MALPLRPLAAACPSSSPARRALALAAVLALTAACAGDGSAGLAPASTTSTGSKPTPGTPAPSPTSSGINVLAGASLWVDTASNARRTATAWRESRPADAALLEKIATQPHVRWFGNWNADVAHDVDVATTTMSAAGALPVLVAYNIPQRDCGGHSGGTTTTADDYRSWITAFAQGIGARRAAVILEPDALAGMDCLSSTDQQLRLDLFNFAVTTLRARGSIAVYLDAGNSGWQPVATIASRLSRAGIAAAQGFALNVSNFLPTSQNVAYGRRVSALIGDKHFLIDTGRNGTGGNGQWCNPEGRALGERPTTSTGEPLVDAFFWVKAPGESDGGCSGGGPSGTWMPEYALGLATRAAY